MPSSRYVPWLLGVPAVLFIALALPWPRTMASRASAADAAPESQDAEVPKVVAGPEPSVGSAATGAPAPTLGDIQYDAELRRYVAPYGGKRAVLTLEPELQSRLRKLLADQRVPWGVTVLLEPSTGRVLAAAEHSQSEPNARDLSLRALAPAASIFKIVTSAALLESGVAPNAETCFHGGKHRIQKRHLADDPRRDRRCLSLSSALGHSANVVFAKLAARDLSAEQIRMVAQRFLFNVPIPFAKPVEISRAEIPDEDFERATTAAGFGPVRLSPMHGALLAAIVANGGIFVPPQIVERTEEGQPPRGEPSRVLDERVASVLAEMMRTTVTEGTARKAFRSARRGSPLSEVSVAGKTGSLSDSPPQPFRDYSWFVGFAPVEKPRVAVATVIVNERLWRVRAPFVAREALREYFASGLAEAQASVVQPPRSANPCLARPSEREFTSCLRQGAKAN